MVIDDKNGTILGTQSNYLQLINSSLVTFLTLVPKLSSIIMRECAS